MVVRVTALPLVNLPEPTGLILHQQISTTAHIGDQSLGTGTLYVAESQLQWTDSSTGLGFVLEYPRITMHAISRDVNNFPEECIYLQFEKENTVFAQGGGVIMGNDDDDDEEEAEDSTIEINLVPQDKASLEDIFQAMNQAQKMNPDPNDSPLSEDDDDEEGGYDDGQFHDVHEGNGNGNIPNGYAHGSSEDEGMELDDGNP